MLFAQINDNVIQNIIVLDNSSMSSIFSAGFQYFIQVDILNPQPDVGWTYDGTTFSPPMPIGPSALQVAITSVEAAVEFGQNLINQFAAQNLLTNITASGQTGYVLSYTMTLSQCLYTGSLYAAISVLEGMLVDTSSAKTICSPFITNDIIYTYLNSIQSYLEIPLSVNPGP